MEEKSYFFTVEPFPTSLPPLIVAMCGYENRDGCPIAEWFAIIEGKYTYGQRLIINTSSGFNLSEDDIFNEISQQIMLWLRKCQFEQYKGNKTCEPITTPKLLEVNDSLLHVFLYDESHRMALRVIINRTSSKKLASLLESKIDDGEKRELFFTIDSLIHNKCAVLMRCD